jgi:acyl carrier protein phosphodiesterase
MNMIQSRSEILTYIATGKIDRWITRETHQGRDLIPEVRRRLDSPSNYFPLKHWLGSRRKVNKDFISEVAQLTRRSPRLTYTHGCMEQVADDDCELGGLDAAEDREALRERGRARLLFNI